jgi:hypothetical protein
VFATILEFAVDEPQRPVWKHFWRRSNDAPGDGRADHRLEQRGSGGVRECRAEPRPRLIRPLLRFVLCLGLGFQLSVRFECGFGLRKGRNGGDRAEWSPQAFFPLLLLYQLRWPWQRRLLLRLWQANKHRRITSAARPRGWGISHNEGASASTEIVLVGKGSRYLLNCTSVSNSTETTLTAGSECSSIDASALWSSRVSTN